MSSNLENAFALANDMHPCYIYRFPGHGVESRGPPSLQGKQVSWRRQWQWPSWPVDMISPM